MKQINKHKKKRMRLLFAVAFLCMCISGTAGSQVQAAQTGQAKKQTEKLGKNNETLPDDLAEEDVLGLPALEGEEQRDFATLQLSMTKTDTGQIRLAWNAVAGADGYELYGARCNTATKRYRVVRICELGAPTLTAWMCSNLKENTYYKFIVRAYQTGKDGTRTYLVRSRCVHIPTTGGQYGYISSVQVKNQRVSMHVGGSYQIKAQVETSGKKLVTHKKLRYESTKPKVVSVDEDGTIHALKKGKCVVYIYAPNGTYTAILVKV